MNRPLKMLIAGGGTGGHLFPGIAVAEAFLSRHPGNKVLFVGTERGLERRVLPELGYELALLDVEGIKGRGGRALGALMKIPKGMMQSRRILKRFGPQIVLGVGGYASGPAVLTAVLMGIPSAVAEQNAIPGMTNMWLSRFVDKIFLSFPDVSGIFPPKKARLTGNPVRSAFRAGAAAAATERPGSDGGLRLLVFGGSQGAHGINMAMAAAVPLLADLKDRLSVVHQTGEKDAASVAAAYRESGISAEVKPFILDVQAAYAAADLLLCRAGATTLAEVTAMGKAAILIPFPYAANDHQTRNAEVLVAAGAAQMVPEAALSPQVLAETIRQLCLHPEERQKMEIQSKSLGNIQAADAVVDGCIDLLQS